LAGFFDRHFSMATFFYGHFWRGVFQDGEAGFVRVEFFLFECRGLSALAVIMKFFQRPKEKFGTGSA
jgi:hypothetical protein